MSYAGGWEGDVKIGDSLVNMRAATPMDLTDVDAEVKNNLEEIFKMGSRSAQAIKEGIMNIAGKLMANYVDNTEPAYAVQSGELTEYWIGIYPHGYTSTEKGIYVIGKFDGLKLGAGVGKVAKIEMPIKARDFQFDTVP